MVAWLRRSGLRLWVMVGAVLTAVFNWATSYATSSLTMAIPLGMAGFVNAACWAPAMSMISQWWPRSRRGVALGIVGTASGGAMLVMWALSGWVGAEFGWRTAFRYLPIISAVLGIGFFFLVRDRPADLACRSTVEGRRYRQRQKLVDPARLRVSDLPGLLTNCPVPSWPASQGLENVSARPDDLGSRLLLEVGGLSIGPPYSVTVLLPVGYLIAPPLSVHSDFSSGARDGPWSFSCLVSQCAIIRGNRAGAAVNETWGQCCCWPVAWPMGISHATYRCMGGRRMARTASGSWTTTATVRRRAALVLRCWT